MAAATRSECIIAALQARGEKEVTSKRMTKYRVFQRSHLGLRDDQGKLVPTAKPAFWYVSTRGHGLRVGYKRPVVAVSVILKDALVAEGRAILKNKGAK